MTTSKTVHFLLKIVSVTRSKESSKPTSYLVKSLVKSLSSEKIAGIFQKIFIRKRGQEGRGGWETKFFFKNTEINSSVILNKALATEWQEWHSLTSPFVPWMYLRRNVKA